MSPMSKKCARTAQDWWCSVLRSHICYFGWRKLRQCFWHEDMPHLSTVSHLNSHSMIMRERERLRQRRRRRGRSFLPASESSMRSQLGRWNPNNHAGEEYHEGTNVVVVLLIFSLVGIIFFSWHAKTTIALDEAFAKSSPFVFNINGTLSWRMPLSCRLTRITLIPGIPTITQVKNTMKVRTALYDTGGTSDLLALFRVLRSVPRMIDAMIGLHI